MDVYGSFDIAVAATVQASSDDKKINPFIDVADGKLKAKNSAGTLLIATVVGSNIEFPLVG